MEVITSLRKQEEFALDTTKASQSDILNGLKKDGLVILPNYIQEAVLEGLNKEFENLLVTRSRAIKAFDLEKGAGVGITRSKLKEKEFPYTHWFYNQPLMHDIKDKYVHPTAPLNSKIYVVNDVVGTTTYANTLHYDVQKCLKFFIYLNDVTANNGAFEFIGGTHHWVENIRRSSDASNITFENRDFSRKLPFDESHVIPLEAKAGTMFIFDTDIFHRTGTTSLGERKIMRGHTYFDQAKGNDPLFKKTI